MLERWDRRYPFINPIPCPEESAANQPDGRVLGAIVGYMMRRLSRGVIPDVDVVARVLRGEEAVPDCDHIGCYISGVHGH